MGFEENDKVIVYRVDMPSERDYYYDKRARLGYR